ncbi:arginine permease [Histoplasma capsulatum G186AR]|uniref:Arginine permease n=2 Tax=Ajellomyces capsulatus TaxID=5037 RepID=C0NHZ1_AJECG|nr:arginine permease [Histoplasma capsulatum G186AR]EEH09426.1 arginine permease [Histoplasma capsulatum G186AR]
MADLIDHESLNQDEKGTTATVGDTSSSPCHESFWHQSSQLSQLQRKLKSRHLQMIAIGGTVGTGLFIGSGEAISTAGPAGALIAYTFVGSIVYSVIVSLGEMATCIPVAGAFTTYATRFADPSLGFAMGWIYWFSWSITFALELTATSLIIQFWIKDAPAAIFIGVFWLFITSINLLPVSFYGEIEFWFSSIKVVTVIGFMIFGICINAGAGQQGYLGFKYWKDPGAFAPYLVEVVGTDHIATAKFIGFWATLIQAGFSYQGTELVGIAAGEAENPRKAVPAAIKKTFYRILFLFVLTIFFIGILIPYTNQDLMSQAANASASPFVIAAKLAGVRVLPSLINAVLLTVVISAANSSVYSGSRILVGLSRDGCAPKPFSKTTKGGVPIACVLFTAAFGLLGFLNLSNSGAMVFEWFMNISGIAGFIAWSCINGCHLRFMRALRERNISRDALPYKAPFQPYLAWYGLSFNILIIITQGFTAFLPWELSNFFVAYISLFLFIMLYFAHKVVCRTTFVKLREADVDTGRVVVYTDTSGPTRVPTTTWELVRHRIQKMFF